MSPTAAIFGSFGLSLVDILAGLGAAGLAGLLGSPHCVGMCGGFACAVGDRRGLAAWSTGRLLTYGGLGAIAGAFGSVLPSAGNVGKAVALGLLLFLSLRLAGLGGESMGSLGPLVAPAARLLKRGDMASKVVFGSLTGLLPCGLSWAALALPVASGSAVWGALQMVAFGLGTVPALALAAGGLRRLTAGGPERRRVFAALVFVSGTLGILLRPSDWMG